MSPSVYLSLMALVLLTLGCGTATSNGRSRLRASFRAHPARLVLLAAVMALAFGAFAAEATAVLGPRVARHIRWSADIPAVSCYAFFGCSLILGLLLR